MGLFGNKKAKKQTGAEHVSGKNNAGNAKKAEQKQANAVERRAVKEANRREAKYAAAKKKAARDERKEREAEEHKRKEAEKAALKAREEAERKADEEARRKMIEEQALPALERLLDKAPLNNQHISKKIIGFRKLVYDTDTVLIQLLLGTDNSRKKLLHYGLDKKTIDYIKHYVDASDFYEVSESIEITERALAFLIPQFDDAKINFFKISASEDAGLSRFATSAQLNSLSDTAFEMLICVYDNWKRNDISQIGVSKKTYDKVCAEYAIIDETLTIIMQRREFARKKREQAAQKELDKRAFMVLEGLFDEYPLNNNDIRKQALGFRSIIKGEIEVVQLITMASRNYLCLHDHLSDTQLSSIRSSYKKYSYDMDRYSFINVPDSISEIKRAFSLFLPEFDCINLRANESGPLPYPRKADLSGIITAEQISDISDISFETILCVHDNWIKNNGVIASLNIKRELYDEVSSTFSQMDELLMAEKQKRREARIESERKEIIAAGVDGEKEVNYALSWLGPDYKLITSSGELDENGLARVKLKNPSFRDEAQEYDHIRVGPQGVFVIEAKNLSGEIRINSFGKWVRKKKNETEFRTINDNPQQQLTRHRKVVESILQDAYPQVNVICIICISNKNAEINGEENCKYPVVIADAIADYIEDYKSNTQLSKEEMEAVAEHIKSFIVE